MALPPQLMLIRGACVAVVAAGATVNVTEIVCSGGVAAGALTVTVSV
jgi:hypothetical protein